MTASQLMVSPHGVLVVVDVPAEPEGLLLQLPPEEQALAEGYAKRRIATFAAGRTALRLALQHAGISGSFALLRDDRGAPILPASVRGSIAHKDTTAVALVAVGERAHLGVDIEDIAPSTTDVSRHVLTPAELAALAQLTGIDRTEQVLLRFSLKEALYKAIDPTVRRYVGFQEVEVTPHSDGTATISLSLKPGEGPFTVDAHYTRRGEAWLTSVRARMR